MRSFLLVVMLFAGALPLAQAQWMAGLAMTDWVIWPPLNLNLTKPVRTAGAQTAVKEKEAPPLLAPARPAVQANARELAARFPADHRAQMEQIFSQSMDAYGQLAAKLEVPPRDMAGSLSAFIVGNYMAMHDAEVSDEVFKAVARQLRAHAGLRELGKKVKGDQLRNLYEQSAMVGTFMALTWKSHQQNPQPPEIWTNVRNATRANLEAVLHADPSRLKLDAAGMSLEP